MPNSTCGVTSRWKRCKRFGIGLRIWKEFRSFTASGPQPRKQIHWQFGTLYRKEYCRSHGGKLTVQSELGKRRPQPTLPPVRRKKSLPEKRLPNPLRVETAGGLAEHAYVKRYSSSRGSTRSMAMAPNTPSKAKFASPSTPSDGEEVPVQPRKDSFRR